MNIIIEEVVSEFPIEILEEVFQITISDAVSYFDIVEVADTSFVGKDGYVPVVDEATGKLVLSPQEAGPGGGVPEAPNNANAYVRSGLAWVIGYAKTAIDNLLSGKFDNPTGNNTQYLDGAGVPTIFPTIPSPQNIQQVLTEGNIAENTDVIFTNTSGFNMVLIDSSIVTVRDYIGDYVVNIAKESILAKNNVGGTTKLLFESTTTDEEFTIPNETGTAATREWVLSNPPTISIAATTGSVISFDTVKIYNTFTTPTTANITNDLTGAKIGIVQKIYSNKSVAPTFPAGWVKIGGDYKVSVVNIIYAEWSEGSRVEYWIIKG